MKSLDPNALAEELVKLYTENHLDRKEIIWMILPKIKDLDEFKGDLKSFEGYWGVEETGYYSLGWIGCSWWVD